MALLAASHVFIVTQERRMNDRDSELQKLRYDNKELREGTDRLAAELTRLRALVAALGSGEVVGYGVFWQEQGQIYSVLKSNKADALQFAARIKSYQISNMTVERIYRTSTPAPNVREALVRILRSRIRTRSPADDTEPYVVNAEEVADLIIAALQPADTKRGEG